MIGFTRKDLFAVPYLLNKHNNEKSVGSQGPKSGKLGAKITWLSYSVKVKPPGRNQNEGRQEVRW